MATKLGMLGDSFKLNSERGAGSASFTRRINFAAMTLDDCFGDRQSQAKTVYRRRPLFECFEYFWYKVRFDSFSGVCDLKENLFSSLIKRANRNCPACGRELLSIF